MFGHKAPSAAKPQPKPILVTGFRGGPEVLARIVRTEMRPSHESQSKAEDTETEGGVLLRDLCAPSVIAVTKIDRVIDRDGFWDTEDTEGSTEDTEQGVLAHA